MDDVTDTVFRQVVGYCSPPDLFFTEFVNVDALQSRGRESTLKRLRLGPNEGRSRLLQSAVATSDSSFSGEQSATTKRPWPIIAQVWGLNPENFAKSAQEIAKMGYDGIDINFGCPDKNVVRNGACSAMIKPENRALAIEIIQASREGSTLHGSAPLPLSVKTRLGFNEIDYSWHETLLEQKLNALTIHGRTKKQMSKVPADWDAIGHISKIGSSLSPETKIIGNGDVLSRSQGEELAKEHNLDGIMIGRGIFQNPYIFADSKDAPNPWSSFTKQQKIDLYTYHVKLFADTWEDASGRSERKIYTLNKFCKIYINGFEGAKELREKLMSAKSTKELLGLLETRK